MQWLLSADGGKESGMEWYRELYTGKSVREKKERFIRETEAGTYEGSRYLITLAANPRNELEILPVRELHFAYLRKNCPLVVGIAGNRREALEVLETIAGDVYRATGDVKIRKFFLS